MPKFDNPLEVEVYARGVAHQKKEDAAKEKCQRRHNWSLAIFNVLGGAVAGLLTSVIFWLLTTR